MNLTGNVWDNAVMESFFSWLKIDRTREQAKSDLFNYIKHFYNNPTRGIQRWAISVQWRSTGTRINVQR